MTYTITSECIACHRCQSVCPTEAIRHHEHQYQINAERCNDCVGHYSVPQCWAVCPTAGGCVALKATQPFVSHPVVTLVSEVPSNDYWDTWFQTYDGLVSRLNAKRQSDYWQHWFNSYSQTLSRQLLTPKTVGVNA